MKHLTFVMAGDLRQEYEIDLGGRIHDELFSDVEDRKQYVFDTISQMGYPGGWFKVVGGNRTVNIAHVAEVYLKEDE